MSRLFLARARYVNKALLLNHNRPYNVSRRDFPCAMSLRNHSLSRVLLEKQIPVRNLHIKLELQLLLENRRRSVSRLHFRLTFTRRDSRWDEGMPLVHPVVLAVEAIGVAASGRPILPLSVSVSFSAFVTPRI